MTSKAKYSACSYFRKSYRNIKIPILANFITCKGAARTFKTLHFMFHEGITSIFLGRLGVNGTLQNNRDYIHFHRHLQYESHN